jgi:hypothetical protein
MNELPVENNTEIPENQDIVPQQEEEAEEEESSTPEGWTAFQEITKGDWKRLMGCGG